MTLIAMRAELRKIFWRGKYRALLAIDAALCALIGFLGVAGARIGSSVTLLLSDTAFNALSFFCTLMFPLTIFMLATDLYTQEFESKSIKSILVRPVNRLSAYFAKSLAILAYIAVSMGAMYLISAAFQLYSGRNTESLLAALASYALSVLPMAAFVATAAFIAVLIPSPTLAMFLSVAAYAACAAAGVAWGEVGAVLYTSYIGWYKMWIGQGVPARSIATALMLLLSHIAIFSTLGYLLFDRKDV
ncbi:MAG: ABC transporter permease [Clostridiales bacterium]|jgi:ABC-2 type transport system permease protein|nr:ABC transporter permease [Clostridiales bacterium]